MSRYVVVLLIVFLIVFALVIGSYYLLTAEQRDRDAMKSDRSKARTYSGIRPGRAYNMKLIKTKYKHSVSKSDGRANLINQPNQCKIWGGGDRIHGGKNAEIGDFPFIALLEYVIGVEYKIDCAGSLINHRYVITAAHCLFQKNLVNVRLGEYDLSKNPDTDEEDEPIPEPINVDVEKTIIHQNYAHENYVGDIGLIRLSMDIKYEQFSIEPICIPDSSVRVPDGQIVIVAGWGNTGDSKRSTILQKVGVPIYNFEKCQQKLTRHPILPSQLCAGGVTGQDACIRDSGGPLIATHTVNKVTRTYLEGIVSYGYGCGKEGMPAVYTRVSYYHGWILQNLEP